MSGVSLNNRKVKTIFDKLHALKARVLSKKMNKMISKSKNDTRKLNDKLNHLFHMKSEWKNKNTKSQALKNTIQARKLKSPNKSFGRKISFSERLRIRPVISPVMEPLYDPLENINRLPDSPVHEPLYEPRLSPIPNPMIRRHVIRRPVIKKPFYKKNVFNSTVINKRFIR